MSSTGLGLRTGTSMRGSTAYGPGLVAAIAADYLLGLPPAPVWDIPYLWLRRPLAMRQDGPINDQRVSRTGGGEYRSLDQDSLEEHQTWPGSAIELDTDQAHDPKSLATHITSLHTSFRDRCPKLTFDLLDNTKFTDWDRRLLLGRGQGDRILITDPSVKWPPGMERLTIEGVRHEITGEQHLLTWNTSPMLGTGDPGETGPWFQVDVTPIDTDPVGH